jgi:hypothetical protein
MSLAKLVPDGLKNRECERTALHEPPPVSYMPKKEKVQETVSTMKGLQLKTSIGKDTTIHFPMWNSGTIEAMLMHVMATLDAIQKRGHFHECDSPGAVRVQERSCKAGKGWSLCFTKLAKVWENPRSL